MICFDCLNENHKNHNFFELNEKNEKSIFEKICDLTKQKLIQNFDEQKIEIFDLVENLNNFNFQKNCPFCFESKKKEEEFNFQIKNLLFFFFFIFFYFIFLERRSLKNFCRKRKN